MSSFGKDIHVRFIHCEKIQGFHDQSENQRVDDIGVHFLNEKIEIGESNNINLKTLNLTNNLDDTERYSIGLSNSNFVIRDNINEVDKMVIDKSTGVITFNPPLTAESSISNLVQLEDVVTSNLTDGNILFYNSNSNKFEFHNETNFNSSTIQIGHLYIDTSNNRLGINVANPEEDLEIDGNIQIDTGGLGRLVFYDKQADHEHAEVDADDDGTTGGQFLVKVKQDGGSVTTRLNIRENGDTFFNTSNFNIKDTIGCNFDLLTNVTTNTVNIATNTSNITSNSNYMVSLSNQQDINTTNILGHSNLISNVFTPYLQLNDSNIWRFRDDKDVYIQDNLVVSNRVYIPNLPNCNTQSNDPMVCYNLNTKNLFYLPNCNTQVTSNSNQILINSLSISDLTSSNSNLCNQIDAIITSSNYSSVTASNSQSNVSLCNQVDSNSQSNSNLCNQVDSNSQSNSNICNYIQDLYVQIQSNSQSNLQNKLNIENNDNDISDLTSSVVSLQTLTSSNSQSNVSLCNLALSNSQSNSNICNYLTNLVISNYDDITSSNSQSNISLCNLALSNSQSNSNICNSVDYLLVNAIYLNSITSSNSQSNLSLCNLALSNSQSNSNICNYLANLVISNYDDITSSNSQSNVSLCNLALSNSQSNSNICNYITNLVISNYDDITSSNSQSNVSLCNLALLNSQSNLSTCNYLTNLVISNYDDITSSNSQSNVSLCNLALSNSQSNSNICNYLTNLVISNYDDITSSNSQSNVSLCNLALSNSQSNSNMCNYLTNLVISNYDDITTSNSQSNISLCNLALSNSQSNSNICNYIVDLCNDFQSNPTGITDYYVSAVTTSDKAMRLRVDDTGNVAGGEAELSINLWKATQLINPFSMTADDTLITNNLYVGASALHVSNHLVSLCNDLDDVVTCNEINCNSIVAVSNCNLDLCNRVDAVSNSNSNLCNTVNTVSNLALSNSQSNSNICNYIVDLCNDFQSNPTGITDYYVSSVTTSNKAMRLRVDDTGNVAGGESELSINLWKASQLINPFSMTADDTLITNNLYVGASALHVSNHLVSLCNDLDDVVTCNEINCNSIVAVSNCNLDLCNKINSYLIIRPDSNIFSFGDSNYTTLNSTAQGSIALGNRAAEVIPQTRSVNIGLQAGNSNAGASSLNVGALAGKVSAGCNSVNVGRQAGESNTSSETTNIGAYAGSTSAAQYSTNLGYQAGDFDAAIGSTNIGAFANTEASGDYSIAIGHKACFLGSCNNTICINADSNQLNPTTSGLFINPITESNVLCNHILQYNSSTKEITYTSNCNLPNYDNITQSNSNSNVSLCNKIDNLSNSNLYLCNYIYINPSTNGFGLGDCNFESSSNGTDVNSTAVGSEAARYEAYNQVTCVGNFAGRCNCGFSAVALGAFAGRDNLGDYSLAIGYNAAKLGSCNNTIILSAESADLNPASTGFFVSPITECNTLCNYYLQYNATTKEISYASNCNLPSGGSNYDDITTSNSNSNLSLCNEIDSQSNSNVTLCNTFVSFRPVILSNSNSNLSLCNEIDNINDVLTYDNTSKYYAYGESNFMSGGTVFDSVAIGRNSSRIVGGFLTTNVGAYSGESNSGQGSLNLGYKAGLCNAGQYSINIGFVAGRDGTCNNSICLNASGSALNPASTGFFVNPITESNVLCNHILQYNSITREISYTSNCNLPSGGTNYDAITQSNSNSNSNLCNQINDIEGVLTYNNTCNYFGYGKDAFSNINSTNIDSVAIGHQASKITGSGFLTTAIGAYSAMSNAGQASCSFGYQSHKSNAGDYSIAIGFNAGRDGTCNNSIVINANSGILNPSTSGLFINPITESAYSNWYNDSNANLLYNFQTKEITYSKHRFSKFIINTTTSVTTTVSDCPIASRELGSMEFNTNGTVTIPERGIYRVLCQNQYTMTSGTARTSIILRFYINTNLTTPYATNYMRGLDNITIGSLTYENILELQANDVVKMGNYRMDDNASVTRLDQGILIIERLN